MRWALTSSLVAATVLFLAAAPPLTSSDVPLPWDMAHHFGGALELRDALRAGSGPELVRGLRAPDLYPPGHSLVLGAWLLVAGDSAIAGRLFQLGSLWACVIALGLLCRGVRDDERPAACLGACAALLLTAPIAGLAATFMVEIPAIAAALFGLAAIDAAGRAQPGRRAWPLVVVAALGVAAPLLTKANIGLPIIAGGFAAAGWHLLRGRPRAALVVALGCLAGVALWVGYLTWQHDGWTSFLAFARNRADATPHTPWWRLGWYARLHARAFTVGWSVSTVMLALAGWGLWRRPGALTVAAGAAAVAAVAPLALHPYLLDRNLVAPAALLAVPCGLGIGALWRAWRRPARLPAVVVPLLLAAGAAALGAGTVHRAAGWSRALMPARLVTLAPASRFVAETFAVSNSCRVLGTFNEFSPGWVHILWRRAHPGGGGELVFDLPYPLARSRSNLDARPDSAYAIQAGAWASDRMQEDVLAINVAPSSVWDSGDFRAWGAWKRNEIAAVTGLASLRRDAQYLLADSSLCIEHWRPDLPAVVFGDGWGPAEPWGRWSLNRDVAITLRRPPASSRLVLRYASFEGLAEGQACSLFVAGTLRDQWMVTGRAWAWQERAIPLADLPATRPVAARLVFGGLHPAFAGDPRQRALPFADVRFAGDERRETLAVGGVGGDESRRPQPLVAATLVPPAGQGSGAR